MFEAPTLPESWFIAWTSAQLGQRPLPLVMQGVSVVGFRDARGTPVVLTDRCPHRNVPLSMGRVTQGTLECAYHGWRFDGAGRCVDVPGLARGDTDLPSRCVERWPVREEQGFVWVYSTPQVEPASSPFTFPHVGEAGWSTVRREFTVDAPMPAVVENILDVPHTAFLHGGLFRTAKKKNLIDVVVRRHDTWAEAQFIGEPVPRGLLGWLLAPRGGVVTHADRFLLPSIAQVEYALGPSRLVASSALTPEHSTRTRIFAVVSFTLPLPGWLVKPFVAPVAHRVFAQDKVMLERQTRQLAGRGSARFTSTELDVLGPQVAKLVHQQATGAAPGPGHEHRLQMRT